jgi:hypothetical protein
VSRHIFQACPVWIYAQSNITQASFNILSISCLKWSLRCTGTCRGGWITGSASDSKVIWYDCISLNVPSPSNLSGYSFNRVS